MGTARSLSRRGAIRSLLGAAVAPTVLTVTKGRAAPSERITMGCIGVGNMGKGNLGAFLGRGDVQIVAIADVKAWEREGQKKRVEAHYANQTGRDYKGCAVYNDFRELLARDDIDAVMIATPDHWHALVAIEAARQGKDMYCEKPMTLTQREARALANAIRRYGRVFQTGSQQRSSGEFRQACELIRNGRIGRVERINVDVGGPSRECWFPTQPIPDGLDWEMWLGPAPWAPYNEERGSGSYGGGWRQVRDYSGGGMTDWGAHHFDIAQWALGMDQSGPVEVHAPDGADYPRLTFLYANGVRMEHGGGMGNGVLFHGTEGRLFVTRGKLQTWPETIQQEPLGANDVRLFKSPGHHANFIDCVRTRQRPICDVEIGCRSVTVCHLGNIAYWTRTAFHWDPVKEEIPDNAAAARWLDRPRRGPWQLT